MQFTDKQREVNLGRDGSLLKESHEVNREVLAQNAELIKFLEQKRRNG